MNIFVHGWSFSKEIWKDFFDIKNSVFLDLPFHGENRVYNKKKILETFSENLFEIIDKSEKPVNLIGWSLGASICVLTALKKPEKLKKLILVGFSPKFKDKMLGHNPVAVKAFMLALKVDFKDTVYNFRKTAVEKEFKDIPLPEKEGGIAILKEFIELDLTEKIKLLDVETVFIHGKKDKIISYKGSEFSSKMVKKSKLILMDSHHAPFLENREIILNNL